MKSMLNFFKSYLPEEIVISEGKHDIIIYPSELNFRIVIDKSRGKMYFERLLKENEIYRVETIYEEKLTKSVFNELKRIIESNYKLVLKHHSYIERTIGFYKKLK